MTTGTTRTFALLTPDRRATLRAGRSCSRGRPWSTTSSRRSSPSRPAGRRLRRAHRVRPGLDGRGRQRPDHPVAVPPPAAGVARAAGRAPHRPVVLRAGALRHLRVGLRAAHRQPTRLLHGRHRAGRPVAAHHAGAVLGPAAHRPGAGLGRRAGRRRADAAVHLPLCGPAGRAAGQLAPRLVVADAVAALVIAGVAVREGVEAWRGDGCCAVSPAMSGVTAGCADGCCDD